MAKGKKTESAYEMFNKTFKRNQKLIASTLNAFFLLAEWYHYSFVYEMFNLPYALK